MSRRVTAGRAPPELPNPPRPTAGPPGTRPRPLPRRLPACHAASSYRDREHLSARVRPSEVARSGGPRRGGLGSLRTPPSPAGWPDALARRCRDAAPGACLHDEVMVPVGPADRFDAFRASADQRGRPGDRLIGSLAETRAGTGPAGSPEVQAPAVAVRFGLPAAAAPGPAAYDADLTAPHGRCRVRGRARLIARIGEQTVPGRSSAPFHFPASGVNRLTSDPADTVTSCPGYKVTAVRAAAP